MSGSFRKSLDPHNAEPLTEPSLQQTELAPPKPPRSAFMCFKDQRKQDLSSTGDQIQKASNILKTVAVEWKELSRSERAHYDEVARNDKVRFIREKAAFRGDWPTTKRRAKKNPEAPKRPMSAFLKYSQKRRAHVKQKNPDMSNTDISRLLGEMWRSASASEKSSYVETELVERAKYKEAILRFREKTAKEEASSRSSHQAVVQQSFDQSLLVAKKDYSDTVGNSVYHSRAHSMGKPIDRRIFRSHSIGNHPTENRMVKQEEHQFPRQIFATMPSGESLKGDQREIHPPTTLNGNSTELQFRPSQAQRTRVGATSTHSLHQAYSGHFSHAENQYQRSHIHAADGDSLHLDGFYADGTTNMHGSFTEPQPQPPPPPPFNPSQLRPSHSHYFPDTPFYRYP